MRAILAAIFCIAIPLAGFAADKQPSSTLTHDGGSPVKPKAFDADNLLDKLQLDCEVIKRDSAETAELMDAFKDDKENLVAATDLNNAIDNVLERLAYEGWLLEMYKQITGDRLRENAEKQMREHYGNLAMMTTFSVKSARIVAGNCKSKELRALTAKVERDIQKIAERYQALGKE